MAQIIIKKLSIKGIVKTIPKPEEGVTQMLVRFAGIASSAKTVTTMYGDSIGLIGDFAGINLETGEVSRAPVLYCPDVMLGMLLPSIELGERVEFAFDVGVIGDKTVAVGYRYFLATVIEPADADPMTALLAKVNNALASLAAPELNEKTSAPEVHEKTSHPKGGKK